VSLAQNAEKLMPIEHSPANAFDLISPALIDETLILNALHMSS